MQNTTFTYNSVENIETKNCWLKGLYKAFWVAEIEHQCGLF